MNDAYITKEDIKRYEEHGKELFAQLSDDEQKEAIERAKKILDKHFTFVGEASDDI